MITGNRSNDSQTDVAVIMLVYNHEKWVGQAIESVLKQKTDVNYKLFIHDDASTDNSQKIISKYLTRYPDKITAILEKENQYSKGNNVTEITLKSVGATKYICYCEGDDFWIDENKIQKQYDYMESHPECHYCFGNAYCTNIDGKTEYVFYDRYDWNDKAIIKKLKSSEADFSFEEMVLLDFTPTASIMLKYSDVIESNKFEDSFDLTKRLVACHNGTAHYFNNIFSAYRMGNSSSASGSASLDFEKFKNSYCIRHKKVYENFLSLYGNQYKKLFEHILERKDVTLYWRFEKWDQLKKCKCFNELRPRIKIMLWFKMHCKPLVSIVRKLYFDLNNRKTKTTH